MQSTSILLSTPDEAEVLDFGPDLAGVGALARAFEPTGYAYFALGSTADPAERELRWRRLADQLRGCGADARTVAVLAESVAASAPAPDTLALFTDTTGRLVEQYRLSGSTLADRCGFGTPAVLLPLLAWRQARPPFVAIAIDRHGADICYSAGGDAQLERATVTGSVNGSERKLDGYWSQRRYQQRAEDSWRHNAGQVAEVVQQLTNKIGAQVLLLTGDLRAIQLLRQRLPHRPDLLVEQ
ncbi:MAG: Vms1/Ankzf1 family peptidyl-tRNA hydrolase, partial [Jatrophihabitantaceae bacterium]